MMRNLFLTILLSLTLSATWAQELISTVSVTYTQVQGVDPEVFQTLEKELTTFLNSRKWTNDQFRNNEKIECNFLLNISKKAKGDNIFTAALTIQASRPVYNTDYNSPTVHFRDQDVTFRYDQSQTLQFDDNNVGGSDALSSNLTAVFAYYVYYILGLDYDSFSPNGGSNYFQKAQDIVNRAPEDKSIRGWKSSEGNRNRYWLAEQMLNPKFRTFRTFWYTYHRKGLDMMTDEPKEALKNVLSGIPVLEKLYQDNTDPILLRFYFDAKSTEWANIIQTAPQEDRAKYIKELMAMDVTNANKYRNIK